MTDLEDLLDRAQRARDAGNPLVARGYWRRASRLAPDRLDIWLNLCELTKVPAERERCLVQIVRLDPENVAAHAELGRLQEEHDAEEPPEAAVLVRENDAPEGDSVSPEPGSAISQPTLGMRTDITDEMRRQWDEALAAGRPLVCINHPQTQTGLRCNRCGAPICTKCAVRTPVGFRCRECVIAQQSAFYNARWYDYPLAAFLSLALSVLAALLSGVAGWWFALIISPFAGGLIASIVHRAVGRRRGRWLWLMVAACIILGALVTLIGRPSLIVSVAIYAVTATGAAVGILRLGRSR